jgi:hypothetical protein
VLYALAADGPNGQVDSATLLAEVKVKVSEEGVGNLADTDEGDFDELLNDLFNLGLISGDKAAIVLTPAGTERVEREMAGEPGEAAEAAAE